MKTNYFVLKLNLLDGFRLFPAGWNRQEIDDSTRENQRR